MLHEQHQCACQCFKLLEFQSGTHSLTLLLKLVVVIVNVEVVENTGTSTGIHICTIGNGSKLKADIPKPEYDTKEMQEQE